MEHVTAFSLVVITLSHLCRAELSGWYSANVINDGDFSPKPISEIFTTGPPFSTANPIVVLASSTISPESISTYTTSAPKVISSSLSTTSFPSGEYVSSTPPSQPTEVSIDPRPTPSFQPELDMLQFQNPFQMMQQPGNSQQNPPNYFLIYQQAPQTVQSLPPSAPQPSLSFPSSPASTVQPELSTPQTTFSTLQPEVSFPQSTFSTFQPELSTPTTFSTLGPEFTTPRTTFSTFQPEVSTPQTTLSTFRPFTGSTFGSTTEPTPPSTTNTVRSTRTVFPCNNSTGRQSVRSSSGRDPLANFPTLRIRMVAPSGSITNINVNPTASSTTTRRPTTTRRRTTTKTRKTKRNRNSFDGCTNACQGRRAPICAAPLAVTPIDPNKLKGFPSVCHMACHNSFKRDQYEMLVEGRCGRLRTRIRPVDSDGKLKRVELNKAQYTPAQTTDFLPGEAKAVPFTSMSLLEMDVALADKKSVVCAGHNIPAYI